MFGFCQDSDSVSESETLWGDPSSSFDTGSSTVISMSHGTFQCDRSHRVPDGVPTSNWWRCSNFKHYVQGHFCWIRTKVPFHVPYVFKNEVSYEVHRFLLTHRVNGRPEGVQRTNTHVDVHDGMVIDSGQPVTEHHCTQFWCHDPHLPHVLVVNQLVQFRDKFDRKKLMGRSSTTVVLDNWMSTSSLLPTVLNGRVSTLLDVWAIWSNFGTSMVSSVYPLSKDLLTTSLSCILSYSPLSFNSSTTWTWCSMCSGFCVILLRDPCW